MVLLLRGIVEFLVQLISAIFVALGMAIAMEAAAMALGGCLALSTADCAGAHETDALGSERMAGLRSGAS